MQRRCSSGLTARTFRVAARARALAALFVVAAAATAWAADTKPDPTVMVSNAIPAQQAGFTNSGTVAATFFASNAAPFTVTIDWGDGTPLDTTTGTASGVGCQSQSGIGFFGDCPFGRRRWHDHRPAHVCPAGSVHDHRLCLRDVGLPAAGPRRRGPPELRHGTIPAVSGTCGIVGSLGFAKLQVLDGGCVTTNGAQRSPIPARRRWSTASSSIQPPAYRSRLTARPARSAQTAAPSRSSSATAPSIRRPSKPIRSAGGSCPTRVSRRSTPARPGTSRSTPAARCSTCRRCRSTTFS